MKFYIHYEGSPDHTLAIDLNKDFDKKNELSIFKLTEKKLNPSSLVEKEIKNGEDLFVQINKESPAVSSQPNQPKKIEEKVEKSVPLISPQDALKSIQQMVASAEEAVHKGQFRKAVSMYESILKIFPEEINSLHHLGTIYSYARKFDRAIEYWTRGLKSFPTQVEFHTSLGDSYYEIGDFEKSLSYYLQALKLIEKNGNKTETNKLKALIAKSMYKKGEKDASNTIIMSLLKENEDNVEALIQYGIAVFDKGLRVDALRVFLKLLILKNDHPTVRECLAECVKVPNGAELIENELKDAPNRAPALAFLALVIKDWGAVEQSAQIYYRALTLVPESTSYCLNYVHTLEVLNQYQKAFDEIKIFCTRNKKRKVGTLQCNHVLQIIEKVKNIYDWDHVKEVCSDITAPIVQPYDPTLDIPNDDLDLLALFFTLVKILYTAGCLDIIPLIIKVLEPVRDKRQLHLTTIRNEHAYYCCISELMSFHTLPIVKKPFLYVAGDSHSLAPAWHTIQFKGPRLLYPLLVTGLKVWHLRPESKFYPKHNFWSVINSAPNGAEIIFLFGEIDCREGLIASVDKCRYIDVEEGIQTAINIYMKVLIGLVEKRKFKIYVHPVVPVLNETRSTVILFNKIMQEEVKKAANPSIVWLDFFDALLSPSGGFNTEYDLDGTHMSPKYLEKLSAAIEKFA